MKKTYLLFVTLSVLALLISSCGGSTPATDLPATEVAAQEPVATDPPAATEPPVPTAIPYALKITGNVAAEMGWTEEELHAMNTLEVQAANKDGVLKSYTGVLLSNLLALASPAAGSVSIVFVADDGYTASMKLADALACTDCILSFRSGGGLSTVLPSLDSSMQVKGVVEIQVR